MSNSILEELKHLGVARVESDEDDAPVISEADAQMLDMVDMAVRKIQEACAKVEAASTAMQEASGQFQAASALMQESVEDFGRTLQEAVEVEGDELDEDDDDEEDGDE